MDSLVVMSRRFREASAGLLSGSAVQSQDGAARRYLKGGNAPAVQHQEPVTVPAAQCPAILRKGRDDVLKDLVRVEGAGFLVRNVQVIATSEPDAQHNLCHGHAL
jgi:hypothetical protein